MKHTQGEWKIAKISDDEFGFEIGLSVNDRDAIACVFNLYKSDEEAEANAKLIAASPEMLSILLDLQKYNSMHKEFNDTFAARLNAAIQKATN